jgi:hypothetical protein
MYRNGGGQGLPRLSTTYHRSGNHPLDPVVESSNLLPKLLTAEDAEKKQVR